MFQDDSSIGWESECKIDRFHWNIFSGAFIERENFGTFKFCPLVAMLFGGINFNLELTFYPTFLKIPLVTLSLELEN